MRRGKEEEGSGGRSGSGRVEVEGKKDGMREEEDDLPSPYSSFFSSLLLLLFYNTNYTLYYKLFMENTTDD